jgi:hypothetical protein
MAMNTPICPILSVRNPSVDELCLGADCALFLPSAKKCSLVYIGFKAMMEVQRMQQAAPQQPQAARPVQQ